MRRILLLIITLFILIRGVFGEEDSDKRFSKFVLGVSGVYASYSSLENQMGLSIDDNKFLVGFNIGVIVNNIVFGFTYAYKIYPINDSSFLGYKVQDNFDVYNFDFGYIFTIFEDYLYLGFLLGVSVDGSILKFYKNVDMDNFSSIDVRTIDSKTLSLGVGVRVIIFRNVFASAYYFYSFPNVYYYDGILVENSPIFRPQGLRVIASLTF